MTLIMLVYVLSYSTIIATLLGLLYVLSDEVLK